MYTITAMRDGTFWCECRIQDGTESWTEPTRTKAIHSMIVAARVMNHSYIRSDDITHRTQAAPVPPSCTAAERSLLDDLACGKSVALSHDDPRVRCRITPEECEVLVAIREGDLVIGEPPCKFPSRERPR